MRNKTKNTLPTYILTSGNGNRIAEVIPKSNEVTLVLEEGYTPIILGIGNKLLVKIAKGDRLSKGLKKGK